MTDLIKQLNTQFCMELNKAWLDATLNNNDKTINMERFGEVHKLIAEAREQGYTFNLEYSPNNFINERIMGKDLELVLCSMPEWEEFGYITKMIKECETNNWNGIKPHFEELQRQRMKPILLKYAIKCAKEFGPFFASDKNDTINLFGTCESVADEMVLVIFVFGGK
jgi:hypothetical protein